MMLRRAGLRERPLGASVLVSTGLSPARSTPDWSGGRPKSLPPRSVTAAQYDTFRSTLLTRDRHGDRLAAPDGRRCGTPDHPSYAAARSVPLGGPVRRQGVQ